MANHEIFNQQTEVGSFQSHKLQIAIEHSDWTQPQIDKQALIDFNTMMFPNQVRTYLEERRGDRLTQVKQQYRVVENRLVDPYYGPFQKMIDSATTEEERESLINFELAAVAALPGEPIYSFDSSGLGIGKGIKYMDTFEKNEQGEIVHKERIDLVGEGQELTIEEANVLWTEIISKNERADADFIKPEFSAILFNPSIENRFKFLVEPIQLQSNPVELTELFALRPLVTLFNSIELRSESETEKRQDELPIPKPKIKHEVNKAGGVKLKTTEEAVKAVKQEKKIVITSTRTTRTNPESPKKAKLTQAKKPTGLESEDSETVKPEIVKAAESKKVNQVMEKIVIKPKMAEEVVIVERPKARAKRVEIMIWQEELEKKVEPEIPWWQINFEGIDANDVPEIPLDGILWPDFNYLKDLAWLVSIRQFTLANTNWDQFDDGFVMVPVMTSNHRGSGWHKKAVLLEANRGAKKADIV